MSQIFLMLLYIFRAKAAFSVVIRTTGSPPVAMDAMPLKQRAAASSES
jgi:hypothetical protein